MQHIFLLLLLVLLGGYLADAFGGKRLITMGMMFSSLLHLTYPWAINLNVFLFMFLRIVQGLGEGFSIIAMYSTANAWIPEGEKALLMTLFLTGEWLKWLH